MPSNIEIKAKLPNGLDTAETIAKSLAKDGKLHQHLNQVDTFFHVPQGRLKLRTEDDRSVLISYHRGDIQGPKHSNYVLTPVPDPTTMTQALTMALGVKGTVEKVRKVYLVTWSEHPLTARIHLDQVKNLGDFMEIEVMINNLDEISWGEKFANELMQSFQIKDEELLEGAYMDQL